MPASQQSGELILRGIGVSPGICIGKAYLVETEGVAPVLQYAVAEPNRPNELKRFKAAVKRTKDELHRIIETVPGDSMEHASILETHLVLLKDKMFYGRALQAIEHDGCNAEWALKKVVAELKSMFQAMTDDYLRGRIDDIVHVSDRIMRNLTGTHELDIAAINKRVILVAHDLSPADTSQIQLERIKGFITDSGGPASHTGIIARSLNLPAVQGVENAMRLIANDDLLIVDGEAGVIILRPAEATLVSYEERRAEYELRQAEIARASREPAVTLDGHPMAIFGNIELPEEVVSVLDRGGEGIGLYRTEFQYLCCPTFPDESALYESYRDVVEIMAPRPVTIRTLDINGDKAPVGQPLSGEQNPALGLRAIRYCLKRPEVFLVQLRAILRAAACGNVRVLFPMISNLDEIRQAKAQLDHAASQLAAEGLQHRRDIDIGMMIEVPSAAVMADVMAREVDFFSIGTNDLIQYTLAIDRANPQVAHLYEPFQPAILRLLQWITEAAHRQGIRVFMCGEMAGDPICTPLLLGLGIDELSMNPQAIPLVKHKLRALRLQQAQEFVAAAMGLSCASEVRALTQQRFGTDPEPDARCAAPAGA